jgi:hypothetical protein
VNNTTSKSPYQPGPSNNSAPDILSAVSLVRAIMSYASGEAKP